MSLTVGVYRPGTSLLHRLPVGPKLAGLAGLSVAIVLVRGPWTSVGFLAIAVALLLLARLDPRPVLRSLRVVLVVALIVAVLQWWLFSLARATESLLDLVALALLALTCSATTPVTAMLDAIVRWCGPLRHVGVDPERVGLTLGLAIQAMPATLTLARETRDAARARGLDRSPRAHLTPFVIRVVARAHETGDALRARGIGD
ncbi:MAG: CbiQ family ECF transporter T component [Nocardioides sp.]|uniref:CbiQ family ECF transporter T component n=1 Tax=Nocardioides sp. TaxID=35761 RepID=UPI0039E678E0